jgi:hypothetical protein
MARKQYSEEPEILAESQSQTIGGPTDYRRIINLTPKQMKGLPLGDGTTISMAAGPYSSGDTHISRPVLNKYIGKYLRRLEKEGKIKIEPVRGDA